MTAKGALDFYSQRHSGATLKVFDEFFIDQQGNPFLADIADQIEWWDAQKFPGYENSRDGGHVFRRPWQYTKCNGIGIWRNQWNVAIEACKKERPDFAKDYVDYRPGMTMHGIRRTVITRLLAAGLRPKVIGNLTGHTNNEIVSVYDEAPCVELYDYFQRTGQDGQTVPMNIAA